MLSKVDRADMHQYVRRFTTGIDISQLAVELLELLPEMEKIGWHRSPQQDQFTLQAHPDDFDNPNVNVYHSGCGPTPSLAKDRTDNPRVESDFNKITPLFRGTLFEKLLNDAPFPYVRTRLFILKPKGCFRIHKDQNYKFHMPIITQPGCMWVFPDRAHGESIHCPATGDNYYIDTRIPHTAINGTGIIRYHLCMTSTLPEQEIFDRIAPLEKPLDNDNYPTLVWKQRNEYVWSI